MTYKIGQMITTDKDILVKETPSEKTMLSKGSDAIIGADKIVHIPFSSITYPLEDNAEIKGYDTKGLARYLCVTLEAALPLSDMCEHCNIEGVEFQYILEYALGKIGF